MTDPTIEPGSAPIEPPPPPSTPTPPTAPPADPFPTPSAWSGPSDDGGARWAAIIGGLIVLAIGVWFFLDRTLGVDLPDLDWGALWPLILIGIGAWLVIRSVARRGT
jgi:uncharacterized integral membrane protein